MKSLFIIIAVSIALFGCKKEVLQSNKAITEQSLTGKWQADYLGDTLVLNIEKQQCEMTVPYLVKKDASSAPVKGFIRVKGQYLQTASGRSLSVESLTVLNGASSSAVTTQDAWNLLKNIYVVMHNTDGKEAGSLSLSWLDKGFVF